MVGGQRTGPHRTLRKKGGIMNMKRIVFLMCLWITGQACADNLYRLGVAPTVRPNEGDYYDRKYGCPVHWKKEKDGTVEYKCTYPDGKLMFATLKKNGDMHGLDVDGAYWTYERKTGLVYDHKRDRVFYWEK
jgi:hypothetical protein